MEQPTIEEYKGHPILVLPTGNKYPFSFGATKARLIVQYMEAIKAFVEQVNKLETEAEAQANVLAMPAIPIPIAKLDTMPAKLTKAEKKAAKLLNGFKF